MIKARSLSKIYGTTTAIAGVSFDVPTGEVLGFLGPNGAGKTTTMRILTCFMPATAGTAKVCGHDIFENSMEVRQNVGYMPENVPLYPNLRVNEYLRYRAKLKGLGRAERREQVPALVERCAVKEFADVIIGKLSKGMKQRVGLAATLLGDPPVLILDEPTVGLDPNQIREIRGLIKTLRGDRTVILSTHILPEVEMVCDHLAIIKDGRIALTGALEEITRAAGGSRVRVEARGDGAKLKDAVEKVSGVRRVTLSEADGVATLEVETATGVDARENLARAVAGAGGSLVELASIRTSIEDVFARITATEG